MKYKLLKDLPTWKAWEEFFLKEDDHLYGIDNWKEIMVYNSKTLEKFNILNNKEWFEKLPEKPKSIWDLKLHDEYYYIVNTSIARDRWDWSLLDQNRLYSWNIFLTYEEAQKELNKRTAIQRIKEYCWENDIKLFSNEELKTITENNIGKHFFNITHFYYIYYLVKDKRFDYSFWNTFKSIEPFYFEKEEGIKHVIKNCENDLKIIFNV